MIYRAHIVMAQTQVMLLHACKDFTAQREPSSLASIHAQQAHTTPTLEQVRYPAASHAP